METYKFPTIENSRLDRFPFKEGDRVLILWPNRDPEQATIERLFISEQWGHDVVYSVTVTTDTRQKPFCVCHCLFEKID